MDSLLFLAVIFTSSSLDIVKGDITATCDMFHYDTEKIIGQVNFTQDESSDVVKINGCVEGLAEGKHGFHVHEFGAISQKCLAAGGHFNPENKLHGGPSDTERHIGDLGNLDIRGSGKICFPDFSDVMISLLPGRHNIVGRVLAIHQNEDDLGKGGQPDSNTTGHAGPRIACCVIGLTSKLPSGAPLQVSIIPTAVFHAVCFLSTLRGLGYGVGTF